MDPNAFFWQIQAGKLPPPQAAQTLGMTILRIDAESGALTRRSYMASLFGFRRAIDASG